MLSEEAKRRSQAEGELNIFSEGKKWWHLEKNTHRRGRHPGRVGERGWTERWWCWWWCGWCDNCGWENSGKGRGSQGLLRKSCCAVCSVTISTLSPVIRSCSPYFSSILWELEVWVWVTLCVCVCVCVNCRDWTQGGWVVVGLQVPITRSAEPQPLMTYLNGLWKCDVTPYIHSKRRERNIHFKGSKKSSAYSSQKLCLCYIIVFLFNRIYLGW